MKKIPVIMDCDPGHDDAIALIMAHASDEIDIKAVTTVAGNQTIDKTTLNALKVLSYIGADVPVARGCSKPLLRELQTAPSVHGVSGLDGPNLPDPTLKLSPMSAIELMASVVRDSKEKITLVPTAPLTNIALFLITYPELKNKIEQISLMGGSCFGGNWTPSAEFNILVDPEAAQVVFDSGIPIIMSGLDVTHKAIITEEDNESFRRIGTKAGILVAELLDHFVKFHDETFNFGGSPLHDPCTVAWLLKPSLFKSKMCHVDIETQGKYTTGCTVVDYWDVLKKKKNVEVLFDIDRKGFVELISECLKKLD